MKRIWLGAICGLLLVSANSMAKNTNEETLDQIVAVVNDDVITKTELQKAVTMTQLQLAGSGAPAPAELQKQVLNQLINKKLQLQIAQQVNVRISDADLNRAIGMIAEQNNVSVETLYDRIGSEGLSTSAYRQEMRDQMTMQKLQQQEVVSRISVSPDEVDRMVRKQGAQASAGAPQEYHVEDILIPLNEAPSSAEVVAGKAQAEQIMAKLKAGESVRAAAGKGIETQDLGWRGLAEIPSAFTDAIINLQPKQVAGPIQAANGLHILRLVATRSAGEKAAGPDRKQIEDMLLQRKFEHAVQTWVSKLRGQAFIVTNVKSPHYA